LKLKPAPIAVELCELIKNNVLKGDGATINLTGAWESYGVKTEWDGNLDVEIGTLITPLSKEGIPVVGAYFNTETNHIIFITKGEQRVVYKTGDKPSDKVDPCKHTEYHVIKQDGNTFDIDGTVEWSYDLTTKALNHMAFNPGHIFTGSENVSPIDMGHTTPDEVVGGHIYNIKCEAVRISEKSEFYSLQNVYYLEGDAHELKFMERTKIGDKLLLTHKTDDGLSEYVATKASRLTVRTAIGITMNYHTTGVTEGTYSGLSKITGYSYGPKSRDNAKKHTIQGVKIENARIIKHKDQEHIIITLKNDIKKIDSLTVTDQGGDKKKIKNIIGNTVFMSGTVLKFVG